MDRVTRDIVELRRQNAMLREQLDFAQTLPPDRIAAEVIARDSDNLFSTITINKGSRQGVKPGMPVVAYQGDMEGLVGKVLSVGPGASEILPLYDPQCFVSARLDTTRDEGLVKGEGKDHGTVLLQYVKKTAKDAIQYGDLVVTSGLGGLYPKGINLGRVRDIKAPAYETSLEIEVEPIVNFDRLEYVLLIDAESAPLSTNPTRRQPRAGRAGGAQTRGDAGSGKPVNRDVRVTLSTVIALAICILLQSTTPQPDSHQGRPSGPGAHRARFRVHAPRLDGRAGLGFRRRAFSRT